MNLKAVILKIASWFKTEAKRGTAAVSELIETEKTMEGAQTETAAGAGPNLAETATANSLAANTAVAGVLAAGAIAAGAVTNVGNLIYSQLTVNTAVKIALALKSIDSSLTVDQVQAGTNAALNVLYPLQSVG